MSANGHEYATTPGVVVWFTGLPASGKTTLAHRVREALTREQIPACVLDSDQLREVLSTDLHGAATLGYQERERDAFYAALAALAALLSAQGLAVLVAATANRRAFRDRARAAAARFVEVHVETPLAECARRDPKGLYAAAARGDIDALPGAGAAYEPPERPEFTADGGHDHAAARAIVANVRDAYTDRRPRCESTSSP